MKSIFAQKVAIMLGLTAATEAQPVSYTHLRAHETLR